MDALRFESGRVHPVFFDFIYLVQLLSQFEMIDSMYVVSLFNHMLYLQ